MKLIFFIISVFIFSNISFAKDWTFVTKNTSGLDFFVDYNSIEKNGDNILFWYLSNRKTPGNYAKVGSMSQGRNKERKGGKEGKKKGRRPEPRVQSPEP